MYIIFSGRIAGEIDGEGNTIIHNAIASKISALDFKEMITLLLKSDLDLTKYVQKL